jgi:hypothetical protein
MNEDLKKGDIILAPLSIQTWLMRSSGHRLCCIMIWMYRSSLLRTYQAGFLPIQGPYDIVIPLGTPMSAQGWLDLRICG